MVFTMNTIFKSSLNLPSIECIFIAVDCYQDISWQSTCSNGQASWGGIGENCCRWHGT